MRNSARTNQVPMKQDLSLRGLEKVYGELPEEWQNPISCAGRCSGQTPHKIIKFRNTAEGVKPLKAACLVCGVIQDFEAIGSVEHCSNCRVWIVKKAGPGMKIEPHSCPEIPRSGRSQFTAPPPSSASDYPPETTISPVLSANDPDQERLETLGKLIEEHPIGGPKRRGPGGATDL